MKVICLMAVFVLLFNTGYSKPNASTEEDDYDPDFAEDDSEQGMQNDENEEYYDNLDDGEKKDVANRRNPAITSKPMEFIVNLYQEVKLPCETKDAADDVVMWYKDDQLIFQDNFPIGSLGNLYVIQNKSLVIRNFTEPQAGRYRCVIYTDQKVKPNITHEVYLPTPPRIEYLKADHDIVQLEAGKTLILTCKANGHPKPNISWHKDSSRFGTQGETFILEKISHKDGGQYRCLADNKVGDPAHASIDIKITHKPIVTIEKLTVNTAENYDSELICNVRAVPPAVVNWKKDGKNIVPNDRVSLKTVDRSHILLIKQVQPSDFGKYNCSAVNYLGESHKVVSLVPTPSIVKFIKPKQGKDVVLSWEVESHSPITKYHVQYRKVGQTDWKDDEPEVRSPIDESKNLYLVEYTLKGLEPGNYETRIRSKNTHGWSGFSETYVFEGVSKKHGAHHSKHNKKHHKAHSGVEQNTPSSQEELGNNVEDEHDKPGMQESAYPSEKKEISASSLVTPTLSLVLLSLIVQIHRQP